MGGKGLGSSWQRLGRCDAEVIFSCPEKRWIDVVWLWMRVRWNAGAVFRQSSRMNVMVVWVLMSGRLSQR